MIRHAEHRGSVDEIGASEKCIRAFIIKSIQLIVQGRSGNVFNTNCMSDVGARNNMMIYLEDDPEIGATIKQTLESGFLVGPGDSFTLDILVNWPKDNKHLMVMEVWQFQLEAPTSTPGCPEAAPALTDLRKSRFFERLGTLLKSMLVTTRLLPAYQYSRNQTPQNYQMCYIVRRGLPDINKMGPESKKRVIGNLITQNGVLNVTVFYRTRMIYSSQAEVVVAAPASAAYAQSEQLDFEEEHYSLQARRSSNDCELSREISKLSVTTKSRRTPATQEESFRQSNILLGQVKPAFAEQASSSPADELDEDIPFRALMEAAGSGGGGCGPFEENSLTVGGFGGDTIPEEGEERATHTVTTGTGTSTSAAPGLLRLAFNTEGSSAELSRLFAELKDRVDLDLFHRPPNTPESESLSEDLERHERTLKDFDDFMSEFDGDTLSYGLVDEVM